MSVINREDAIAELMSLLPKLERGLIHWTDVKAMLEALPEIKTDEDMISRAEAINAVKKNTFRLTFAEEQNCEGHVAWSANAVYSDVMEGALLELPSAQSESKTGRCRRCAHAVCESPYDGDKGWCLYAERGE
jgi:hypothetical protein